VMAKCRYSGIAILYWANFYFHKIY